MNIPNFHDGQFEGFSIGPSKNVRLFLRTHDHRAFTLSLEGVQALTISDVKVGNLIFDLAFRNSTELNTSDVVELYGLDAKSDQASKMLLSARERELHILELNSSYGAQGLFLFKSFGIIETPAEKMA